MYRFNITNRGFYKMVWNKWTRFDCQYKIQLMKRYFDFIGSVVCLGLFFWNDLAGLLNNWKWEGLFYFLCGYDCLILIDCFAMIFCSIIFIPFAIEAVKNHK